MSLRENISPERLHHAYLLTGDQGNILGDLEDILSGMGIPLRGNPDVYINEYDVFHLDHAHHLRSAQQRKAAGEKKIFIISFNTIGREAQNALLKTLEEPTEHTHFFFVTRIAQQIFPTLLSRLFIIDCHDYNLVGDEQAGRARRFLVASISERMSIIAPMVKAKADEKLNAKEDARDFLNELEFELYQKLEKNRNLALHVEDVIEARRLLYGGSPSLKLLLEHIALTLPKISATA